MGFYDRQTINSASAVGTFSTRVYGWMSLGLGVTAAVAYFLYVTGIYMALMPFWWVWAFGTFGIAMGMNAALQRLSFPAVAGLFLTYAGLQGIVFGTILPFFAASFGGAVIWTAFATSAGIFLSAALYGMFTKSDLTSLGRILSFALMGLIVVSLIFFVLSLFMPIGGAQLVISYLGLIIFIGLTAYDAQTIRSLSMQADIQSVASYKLSLVMALRMYINVIMLFWYLLRIFSSQRK